MQYYAFAAHHLQSFLNAFFIVVSKLLTRILVRSMLASVKQNPPYGLRLSAERVHVERAYRLNKSTTSLFLE